MGFRNPIVNASQVAFGTLTGVTVRTARTGPRVELQKAHPGRVTLYSDSPIEQAPGMLAAEAVNRPGGHPTAQAVLRTPDVGFGRTSLIVYPNDAFYSSRALVVDDASGDLTAMQAAAFLDGSAFPLPRWSDGREVRFAGGSWTDTTDANGLWETGHSLGTTPLFALATFHQTSVPGRWAEVAVLGPFVLTFRVMSAAGAIANTDVTLDYFACALAP